MGKAVQKDHNFCDSTSSSTHDIGPVGGRLKSYINEWGKLTSDTSILQAISGYKLEFVDGLFGPLPQQRPPMPYRLNLDEVLAVDMEIQKLLQKNVIELSEPEGGQFISNVFTCPKKN